MKTLEQKIKAQIEQVENTSMQLNNEKKELSNLLQSWFIEYNHIKINDRITLKNGQDAVIDSFEVIGQTVYPNIKKVKTTGELYKSAYRLYDFEIQPRYKQYCERKR